MIYQGKLVVGAFYRAFIKYFIAPIIYYGKNGYNAKLYWENRHRRWGTNPIGAGSESFDEHKNVMKNMVTIRQLKSICKNENVDFNKSVLEIGCGSGLITTFCNSNGVKEYTGMDITDVLFPALKLINDKYTYIKNDITEKTIDKKFDVIFVIDVLEHIVSKEKLKSALKNIVSNMNDGAILILGPTVRKNKKHFFYLHSWGTDYVISSFVGLKRKFVPFMCGDAIIVRKNG